MPRLPQELHRLYLPWGADGLSGAEVSASLIDAAGQVRALVLTLARPADWQGLSAVWRGVQAELGLPAPGIAVSGTDGLQLWFSLKEPVAAAQAQGFLQALCDRYLADVAPSRLHLWPGAGPEPAAAAADALPPREVQAGQWSAFVAPDLAPVFADEPWIDLPPNPDGQAELLARLTSIQAAEWANALALLRPAPAPGCARPASAESRSAESSADAQRMPAPPAVPGTCVDPRQFLLEVMNNGNVALALRIEAAKALLPWVPAAQQPAVHLPAPSNSMVLPDSGR